MAVVLDDVEHGGKDELVTDRFVEDFEGGVGRKRFDVFLPEVGAVECIGQGSLLVADDVSTSAHS